MLNLDLIALAVLVAAATAGLALRWRGVRGRAATPWWAAVRVAAWSLVARVLATAGTYRLMNSRTFQVAGTLVSGVPASQRFVSLRKLAAGEEIGSHSFSHARLVGVAVGRVADEVERTDAVIRAAGYGGTIFFRPPYCKKLVSAPYYLWRQGRTTVTWDLEPDSTASPAGDPRAMARSVAADARPGSIILLHPWGEAGGASRRALPLILEAHAARGYSFVTVSELLAAR